MTILLSAKMSLYTSQLNLPLSQESLRYLIKKPYPIFIITKKLFREALKMLKGRKVVVRAFHWQCISVLGYISQ